MKLDVFSAEHPGNFLYESNRIAKTYGVGTALSICYLCNYVDGRSCMRRGCKDLLYCDVIHRKESRRKKEGDQSMTERITYLVTYLEHGKTKTCKVTGRDASAVAGFMNCHHPCATTLSVEPLSTNTNKTEETKMDLTKKITVNLTEDDIKEIIAEYVARELCRKLPKKDDIELVYGVKYSGAQIDREAHGYLIECKVKC